MENLTLSHQVYKSRRYWEDNSPIFCQGLPKALYPYSQSGLQRDKDRSQTSGETGTRQAVLRWGRITSTNPALVPGCWADGATWAYMIDCQRRQMLHEARLPFHHADARMNVVARIRWLAPARSRSGRQVCIWKPFLTAESPLGADALPDPRRLWGRWKKRLRKCFWMLEWKWRNQAEFSQEQEKREWGWR